MTSKRAKPTRGSKLSTRADLTLFAGEHPFRTWTKDAPTVQLDRDRTALILGPTNQDPSKVHADKSMLMAFLNLGRDGGTSLEVLDFVRSYGTWRPCACGHGLPHRHLNSSSREADTRFDIGLWQQLARTAVALRNVADALRPKKGKPVDNGDWRMIIERYAEWENVLSGTPVDVEWGVGLAHHLASKGEKPETIAKVQRGAIAHLLRQWMQLAAVGPSISFGARWKLGFSAATGEHLFAALGFLLLGAVTKSDWPEICVGCHRLFLQSEGAGRRRLWCGDKKCQRERDQKAQSKARAAKRLKERRNIKL